MVNNKIVKVQNRFLKLSFLKRKEKLKRNKVLKIYSEKTRREKWQYSRFHMVINGR